MLVMRHTRYGGPDVVAPATLPRPEPGPGEILVRVHAAGVTTADWRQRAAAYPGGLWLVGRMMTGLLRPRDTVLGGDFAGEVVGVGEGVARFTPGDRVFGTSLHGAHAEYLVLSAEAAVAHMPRGLGYPQGAALAFGAIAALEFLRDVADLRAGQRVLIVGASGGVGVYAVQIAKALGAVVTGVASTDNLDLVAELGADQVVDYRKTDIADGTERFDLVFDTVGALTWRKARGILVPGGLFLPLNFGLADLIPLVTSRFSGKRMMLHVNGDAREQVEDLARMIDAGALRPVIDRILPFGEIREAYRLVEGRHRRGAVILDVAASPRIGVAA